MFKSIKLFILNKKHKGCKINTINIHPSVKLSKNISIAHGCSIGNGVQIGANTYINGYTDIASGVIGKFCSIASFCIIGPNNHPIDWISTSPKLYTLIDMVGKSGYIETKKPPVIGNDVWIGTHSVIFKGIHIGDGAIIAAGSIVTKDVPPYAIVGGTPAKLIKYRFEDEIIDKLLKLKWWELNENELKSMRDLIEKRNIFYTHI